MARFIRCLAEAPRTQNALVVASESPSSFILSAKIGVSSFGSWQAATFRNVETWKRGETLVLELLKAPLAETLKSQPRPSLPPSPASTSPSSSARPPSPPPSSGAAEESRRW